MKRILNIIVLVLIFVPRVVFSQNPEIKEYDAEFVDEELRPTKKTLDNYANVLASQLERELVYVEGTVQVKDEFHLKAVHFKNNVTVSADELKVVYEPYLNTQIKFEHLQDIANRITRIYQEKGYFLSFALIPTQDVTNGELDILVIEGIVDDIYLVDKTPEEHSKLLIKFAQAVIDEQPLTRDTYSTFLTRAEKLPGIKIQPNLVPSRDTVGASTLVLKVEEEKFKFAAGALNHISRRYGDRLDHMNLTYNDIVRSSRTNVRAARSDIFKDSRLSTLGIDHKKYLGSKGAFVELSYSNTLAQPHFDRPIIDDLDFWSRGHDLDIGLTYPFVDHFKHYFSGTFAFQGKNSHTHFGGKLRTYDKTRVLRLGFQYQTKVLALFQRRSEFKCNAGIEKKFKFLGASKGRAGDYPLSVSTGAVDGKRIVAGASWLQPIGLSGFYLNLEMISQVALSKLLNAGQFSYGGMKHGRGFNAAVISGDSGVSALAELNHVKTGLLGNKINYLQSYIAVDFGRTWEKYPISIRVSDRRETATSASAGVRMGIFKHLHMSFYVARPLSFSLGDRKATRFFYLLTLSI